MLNLKVHFNFLLNWIMILANFNRSLTPFLFLIFLITSGCSQQSPRSLTVNSEPEKTWVNNSTKIEKIIQHLVQEKTPSIFAKNLLKKTTLKEKEEKIPSKSSHYKTTGLIWERMLALYALPDIDDPRIEVEIKKFLKYPRHLVKVQQRAAPYLHLILNEIEAKKLPGELALLPIIESAFNPNVSSPRSASGLWQFMPATGRSLGLKQNWWYDGRRDVLASTQAATQYLKQLNKSFKGNWLLALASYNAGSGNIRKAIKKNRHHNLKRDYWSLKLPRETMRYVPKILALAKIFANAEKYKLPLAKIPDTAVVAVVTIKNQIDLTKAAKMAGIPMNEFFILNPAFKRVASSPKEAHHILVKIEKAKIFKQKLASLALKNFDWVKHQIKTGENLKTIAKKYKTSVKNLLRVNTLKNKTLKIGMILKIPPTSMKAFKKHS